MGALLLLAPLASVEVGAAAERKIDFGRDIQPLLARRCFACHGPDKAEAGLRLNSREGAVAELESGEHAVVPGQVEASELLRRVAAQDDDQRMPPVDKPLNAEQIELLKAWIAQGAEWRGHWAFEPLSQTPPPAVQNQAWVQSPIDALVLARLEQQGLAPAPPASKAALLRRLTFDLTGLPPTPAELDAFLADERPDAYAQVVDRLLASPRYGERWGRHWLDVVRFAETNSFERDGVKPHAWRYRDYVIRSLNDDKPYDQFLREQLAGDELPGATADSIIATGYYRLGVWDDEPADRDQARYDELDDIVSTTAQALLGLTINCARCHDHKIDPITQRDYYQMVALFNGIRGMAGDGPNIETQIFSSPSGREDFEAEKRGLARDKQDLQQEIDRLEQTLLTRYREAHADVPSADIYAADLEEADYQYYRDTFEKLPDFDTIRPESAGKLPGNLFDLSPATRETAFGFRFRGRLRVEREGDYTLYLDSDDGASLRVNNQIVLVYDGIHGLGEEKQVTVHLGPDRPPIQLEYFQREHGFGLRLEWSGPDFARRPLAVNPDRPVRPVNVQALMASDGAGLIGPEMVNGHAEARKRLEELKRRKLPAEYALSVTEFGSSALETRILERGNVHAPAAAVEPGVPAILASSKLKLTPAPYESKTSLRRSALADWICAPTNPLTARVMANRVWQQHFGRGIVRSTNNFGALGTPPTHPELLDWLAQQLVAGGWRLKPLHRQIVLSSAYQMSSAASDAATKLDPGNDLFSRFDMRRLSAEELRDAILAVDGRLNLKMHGPGVYPEISKEVLAGQSVPGSGWGASSPEEQARRSIYIHVKRSLITPLLSSFDFPDPDSSCEARFVTTPPTQALAMFNGKFLHDESAVFAQRLAREAGPDPAARVTLGLRLAFSRAPSPAEVARGVELVSALQARHQLSADEAWKFYCLTLLNQNEFVWLD